jgi:eukaryotic-like serine/threonine-protein kinase
MPIPSEPTSKASDASSVRDDPESKGTVVDSQLAKHDPFAEPPGNTHPEYGTGIAPSFPAAAGTIESDRKSRRIEDNELPVEGETLDDFTLLRELGRGAMGVVFLARQNSLQRQVALKVCYNAGHEARTMAVLEHPNIVQVFSELVLPTNRLHLICMQYVAGTTLAAVIQRAHQQANAHIDGFKLLSIVEAENTQAPPLDVAALRDRELLVQADPIETVCWLGARLGESLGYAHRHGVLHRDIKPANVLLDPYGRPRLADFSLSTRRLLDDKSTTSVFGGTLAYMSPEHLDAFRAAGHAGIPKVDERSDIYSLGVVLYELLTGKLPFATPPSNAKGLDRLEFLSEERKRDIPAPSTAIHEGDSSPIDHVIRSCLAHDPETRFQDADTLAAELDGCRELHRRQRALPPPGFFTRLATRHPFLVAVSAAIFPHLIGTAVNIAYNAQFIVSTFSPRQQETFLWLVLFYNSVAYTLGVSGQIYTTLPVWLAWPRPAKKPVGEDRLVAARRLVLNWPRWAAFFACVCWFPGGLFFPLMLNRFAGPISTIVFWHFVVSFALSGLISMTYSMAAVQYLGVRVFYPRMWHRTANFVATSHSELQPIDARLRLIQTLSGLIPLIGASLVVMAQPEHQIYDKNMFQLLAVGLIAMGMAGFQLSVTACDAVRRTISVLRRS